MWFARVHCSKRRFFRPHLVNETMPSTVELRRISDSPDQSSVSGSENAGFGLKLANLMAVVIPFAGLVVAIVLLWQVAFDWTYLAILVGMYLATAIGITVGYHRLFTHCSFKTSRPVVAILAALGSMAVEGPVMRWAATHRRHHQHSDGDSDPHSPHVHGTGLWSMIRGMWHSHIGWMFEPDIEGLGRYIVDLRKDKLVRWMKSVLLSLGDSWAPDSRCTRGPAHNELDRCTAGVHLGRVSSCVSGPSHDVEHQFGLSYLGYQAIQHS